MAFTRLSFVSAAVGLIILCYATKGTAGLRCFVCNSYNDEACMANPPEKYLVDCESTRRNLTDENKNVSFKVCRYMYYSVTFKSGDESIERMHRSCGWLESRRDCYYTATGDIKSTVCQCKDDGCNTATHDFISLATLCVVTMFSLLMLH